MSSSIAKQILIAAIASLLAGLVLDAIRRRRGA